MILQGYVKLTLDRSAPPYSYLSPHNLKQEKRMRGFSFSSAVSKRNEKHIVQRAFIIAFLFFSFLFLSDPEILCIFTRTEKF
jgi:hypothetical protein